jgi:hypothetical protein
MKRFIPLLLALVVTWKFEHGVRDTLEFRPGPGAKWKESPGPYQLTYDGERYSVTVDDFVTQVVPQIFFRVKREWGPPRLNAPLPEPNDKNIHKGN